MTPDRDTALDPVRLPRRNLLRSTVWAGVSAASAGLVTACDGSAPDGGPSPPPKPKPDPDLPVVAAALVLTRRLLDQYTATTARHAGLKAPLAAYVKRHQAHLAALSDGSAGPKPSPTPSPTASTATASPTAPAVAGSAGAAVRALISLESSAAEERSKGLARARNPELARLLASIGACEALHALALAEVGDG